MLQVRIAQFPAPSAGVEERSLAHSSVTSSRLPPTISPSERCAGPEAHRNGSSRRLLAVGMTVKGFRARDINPLTPARGCAGERRIGRRSCRRQPAARSNAQRATTVERRRKEIRQ